MVKNRKLLIIISVIAILVISTFGTLAYLTDTASVTNTFTIGNISMDLDETKLDNDGNTVDENNDGVPDRTKETADGEEGNSYRAIPAKTYIKDPTVTINAGSEECYVRMLVTIDKLKEFDKIFAPDGADLLKIFGGYKAEGDEPVWIYEKEVRDTEANTITYEFRYKNPVDASKATDAIRLEPLFTEVTIPPLLTPKDMQLLAGEGNEAFHITVVGNAIQSVGFEADTENGLSAEDVAWKAFDTQENTTTPEHGE